MICAAVFLYLVTGLAFITNHFAREYFEQKLKTDSKASVFYAKVVMFVLWPIITYYMLCVRFFDWL